MSCSMIHLKAAYLRDLAVLQKGTPPALPDIKGMSRDFMEGRCFRSNVTDHTTLERSQLGRDYLYP